MADVDIAIDIHFDKLSDWLVSRRKVPAKWAEDLRSMRARITAAVQDLPNTPAIRSITENNELTLWNCQAVFDVLEGDAKAAGTDSKTLFGSYTDPQLKAWASIVSDFTKGNIHLADAARTLVQSTKFDIPDLTTNLTGFKKQIQEEKKKVVESTKAIEDEKKALAESCADMGIKGDNYSRELLALTANLPQHYYDVEVALRNDDLKSAIGHYRAFTVYTAKQVAAHAAAAPPAAKPKGKRGRKAAAAAAAPPPAPRSPADLVPTLAALAEADLPEPPPETPVPVEAPADDGGDVDWGITMDDAGDAVEWDISVDAEGAGAAASGEAADIDWGFETTEAGEATPVEASGSPADVYVVSDAAKRQALMDDLTELQAFLTQRQAEQSTDGVNLMDGMSDMPDALRRFDGAALDAACGGVERALSALTNDSLHRLCQIATNPRYLERLAGGFTRRERQIEKLQARRAAAVHRQGDLVQRVAQTTPMLEKAVATLKATKAHVEAAVSAMFNNRPVHIIGAINSVI